MKNKIQFDHNLQKAKRQHKAERENYSTYRNEYLETKHGYRTQNNYPYSW